MADFDIDEVEFDVANERSPTERWADATQLMAVFCNDPRYQDLPGYALYRQQIGEQPFHALMIEKDGSLSTRQFGAT